MEDDGVCECVIKRRASDEKKVSLKLAKSNMGLVVHQKPPNSNI